MPINFLPKPTFFEQYKFSLISLFTLALIASTYYLYRYPSSQSSSIVEQTAFSLKKEAQFAQCSINKLQMVGFLREENKTSERCWSLVKAPDGQVISVKKGDYLGSEHAQVVDIQSKGTYLQLTEASNPVLLPMAMFIYE